MQAAFEDRLRAWNQLRDSSIPLPIEQCLAAINQWWFQMPWQPYYLHWDDLRDWPDPWQLLSDNIYCDVARGLGIMYTITMLDRADMQDSRLVEENQNNLVLIHSRKYILNYSPDDILNTYLESGNIRREVTQQQIKQKLR
jgi:hypothetical protein